MLGIFKKKVKINWRRRWLAAAMLVVTLIINGIAATTRWMGGQNTGEISDSFPNLFAPAGWTFSIWSLIYCLLILYVLYQLGVWRNKKDTITNETIEKITPYFIATSVLNTAWMLTWQYKILWASVILIGAILFSLIKINDLLRDQRYNLKELLLVKAPFSIYFGWITVATIANVTTWLVSLNWDGWGRSDAFWTVTLLIIGGLIGLSVMIRNRDIFYGAAILWAFFGILGKHLSGNGWDGRFPEVISALAVLIAVVSVALTMLIWRQLKPARNR